MKTKNCVCGHATVRRLEGETGKFLLGRGDNEMGDEEEDEHDCGHNDAASASVVASTMTRKSSLSRDELVKLALDGYGTYC